MKRKLKSLINFWLFILLLSCFVCYLFFELEEKNVSYIKNADLITAKIVSKEKNYQQFPIIYTYKISYEILEQEYTGIIKSINNYLNDQISIYYQQPGWITESKTINNSIISFRLSLLFPLYALVVILINLIKIITINHIIKNNTYVLATIYNIKPLKRLAINKQYLLECIYKDKIYEVKIDSIEKKYIKCNNINEVRIYFLKNNQYYIEITKEY